MRVKRGLGEGVTSPLGPGGEKGVEPGKAPGMVEWDARGDQPSAEPWAK